MVQISVEFRFLGILQLCSLFRIKMMWYLTFIFVIL